MKVQQGSSCWIENAWRQRRLLCIAYSGRRQNSALPKSLILSRKT
jgi:hypothetical protein